MFELCSPALIYLIFSIVQIIFDILNGLYNTAFMKGIVMIIVTFLLNILCQRGLGVVSWIIVFVPFILTTVVVSMLLYIFGMNATSGTLDYKCDTDEKDVLPPKYRRDIKIDNKGNILINDPEYDANAGPVYYSSPNIVIPNPYANDIIPPNNIRNPPPLYYSSSPAYSS
jgi:hypothetical protein